MKKKFTTIKQYELHSILKNVKEMKRLRKTEQINLKEMIKRRKIQKKRTNKEEIVI